MAKRTYTEEERKARQDADRALQAEAAELLSDADAVVALAEQLAATCRSPKVLGYSLRNQALLIKQAEARGMVLTDVDTFRGWRERGRAVRKGEAGLRIVRPRGTEAAEDAGEVEGIVTHRGDVPTGDEAGENEGETRTRFRMTAVFDISQTEGISDAEIIGEAHEVPNPAALLADTLVGQLERRGYQVVTDADAERAEVDDGDLITVPEGRPVAELARALAVVIAAAKSGKNPSTVQAA